MLHLSLSPQARPTCSTQCCQNLSLPVLSKAMPDVLGLQLAKPRAAEQGECLQAGGFVAEGRINGSLNLSRALGDMDYKQSKDLGPDAQVNLYHRPLT